MADQLRSPVPDRLRVFDLNRDGETNFDDFSELIKNHFKTYLGDSNLDSEFNSSDLTLVFQAGEYEDQVEANSTWSEGDWNGDFDFDSSDLVAAFQDGGYEKGPRAMLVAVPEPTGAMPILLGLLLSRIRNICRHRES